MLTLDAMADAALLRACENDARLLPRACTASPPAERPEGHLHLPCAPSPRENSDTYTASKRNDERGKTPCWPKGGTAKADWKYFRHLYNLRWSADWDITDKGTYTLTPQAESNSTGLNWTGGGVTVYCASGGQYPAKDCRPSMTLSPDDPGLGEKIVLTSKTTVLTNQDDPCAHPQSAIEQQVRCKTGKGREGRAGRPLCRPYPWRGTPGANLHHTARGHSGQRQTETVAAGALPEANQLRRRPQNSSQRWRRDGDENGRDARAVGALCGVNTGTLKNCALTRGTNSSTSALVARGAGV